MSGDYLEGPRYPAYRRQPTAGGPYWPFLFLLVAAGTLVWWYWPRPKPTGLDLSAESRPVTPRGDLSAEEQTTIGIFKRVAPSVVHITTRSSRQDFFSSETQVQEGTGSGFVWDDKGHIVTNYHVIQSAVNNQGTVTVILADQSSFSAEWAHSFPDKDLAVVWIKAPAAKLHPIEVGSSHDLQVGQKVFAIGNPFGLDHSLTTGIISALGRRIESVTHRPINNAIQTDASINPGNSGGPLLDSYGRLIGVNTAIFSPSGASAGIGFAIPVDEVNRVVPQLLRGEDVTRVGLNIGVADKTDLERYGVQSLDGVLVLWVKPGSSAARAGLRPTQRSRFGGFVPGDVIVAVDNNPIHSRSDWFSALDQHKVGDEVSLTVVRKEEKLDLKVNLEAETEE